MDWSWRLFLGLHYFLSPFAPCKDVNYICQGQTAVSTTDLIQSEYIQKHLSLLNCWTLDHWMSAVQLQVCHPWHVLQTSLVLRRGLAWGCCILVTCTVQHEFEIWSGDMNLRLLCSFMADFTLSYWQATFGECRQLTVWVQTAKRLFSLRRSYSFGLRFNPALWNRAESELKWNTYITVPWEFSLYG